MKALALFCVVALACNQNGGASQATEQSSPIGQRVATVDSIEDSRVVREKIADDAHARCVLEGTIDSLEVSRLTPHGGAGIYALKVFYSAAHDMQLGTISIRADTAVMGVNPADDALPERLHIVNEASYVLEPEQLRSIAGASMVKMRVIGTRAQCEWQLSSTTLALLRLFVRDEVSG
jgi:hypothetical protein